MREELLALAVGQFDVFLTWRTEDVIVNDVLARLDMLDANLTTADDVPALQRLLASPAPSLAEAVGRHEEYLESVDFAERRRDSQPPSRQWPPRGSP